MVVRLERVVAVVVVLLLVLVDGSGVDMARERAPGRLAVDDDVAGGVSVMPDLVNLAGIFKGAGGRTSRVEARSTVPACAYMLCVRDLRALKRSRESTSSSGSVS